MSSSSKSILKWLLRARLSSILLIIATVMFATRSVNQEWFTFHSQASEKFLELQQISSSVRNCKHCLDVRLLLSRAQASICTRSVLCTVQAGSRHPLSTFRWSRMVNICEKLVELRHVLSLARNSKNSLDLFAVGPCMPMGAGLHWYDRELKPREAPNRFYGTHMQHVLLIKNSDGKCASKLHYLNLSPALDEVKNEINHLPNVKQFSPVDPVLGPE